MKAYALDLRKRVVQFVQNGGTKAEAARRFDLARSSVYRYLAAAQQGALPPKTSWGSWRKLDPEELSAHVKKHPDATLLELQSIFGVSHNAVWVRLRQLGFTLKKLIKYRERNEVQRWLFRRELETLAGRPVYYLDECGVDHRLYREYGRAPRGERIYEAVAGKRRERTSVIAASRNNKLVAPRVLQGSCNTEVVDAYFAQVLLPLLPPGSVIVLDNARFHQSPARRRKRRPG
ncbi:MAG: Transposase [Verrucomicrobia bacterium ADurb.Bin118]|nr:MAG: Transposase [Verrucomicrobia bacterium ADurb.Bin118]